MITVGIDQSYNDFGIAMTKDGKVTFVASLRLKKFPDNTERRKATADFLEKAYGLAKRKSDESGQPVVVVMERIRLHSAGFLSMDYIKTMGAMNALIVDTAKKFNFTVWSADTRAWKSRIVGTSTSEKNKYGIEPKKWPTIRWCIRHGYGAKIRDTDVGDHAKKGVFEKDGVRYFYNDNKADAICIALYGTKEDARLQKEH